MAGLMPRLCTLTLLLLAVTAEASAGEYWRGAKAAKQCKICSYLVERILAHPAAGAWVESDDDGEWAATVSGFCTHDRMGSVWAAPRKGHPVLTHFDSPPARSTREEIGQYCQRMAMEANGLPKDVVRRWKRNADKDATVTEANQAQWVRRLCGKGAPMAHDSVPAWDTTWEPRGAQVCGDTTGAADSPKAGGKIKHKRVEMDSTKPRRQYRDEKGRMTAKPTAEEGEF